MASSVLHTKEALPINTTLNMQKALLILTFKLQVVHSDLKAKNILLTKDQHEAKISDVGLARYREHSVFCRLQALALLCLLCHQLD